MKPPKRVGGSLIVLEAEGESSSLRAELARETQRRLEAEQRLRDVEARLAALQEGRGADARLAAQTEHLTKLQALTSALSRVPDLAGVASAAVEHSMPALGAAAAAIYLLSTDGKDLDLVSHAGHAPIDLRETLPADAWRTVRTGLPQWIEGDRAGMCLPLRIGDRNVGVMAAGFLAPRRISDEDRAYALTLAGVCAQALDRARFYEESTRARADAEAVSRSKDEFLSTVSHELRTPLTAILGWANILRTQKLNPTAAAKALLVIERNARTQAQLVDDLLDVSRMVTGKLRLDMTPVEPALIVRAAVDVVRPTAEAKGISIDALIDDEVEAIAADAARLQQIVWNLLANAVKFTPAGGRIEVRLEAGPEGVQLMVSDTGEGIDPAFLPHVFERFQQASAGHARSQGLGLGLAIVEHLVELHEGTVTAESPGIGRGSIFKVTLPTRPLPPEAPSSRRLDRTNPHLGRLDEVRVLLVDDNTDTRDLVATILRDQGAIVTTARCAAEAVQVFELAAPHVLVSDIGLPDEDGYRLVRRLHALSPVPALALTAYAGPHDAEMAMLAGFERHLAKPVSPARLVDAVARLATPASRPTDPCVNGVTSTIVEPRFAPDPTTPTTP